MTESPDILLITGPGGIGKSTLAWAIGRRLAQTGIAHSLIESDELDRGHPRVTAAELDALWPGVTDISAVNLRALWQTYDRLGHTKLIMTGVMLRPEFDRQWIHQAIPDARIRLVRLAPSPDALAERIRRREGSVTTADEQMARSTQQVRRMASETIDCLLRLETDGRDPDTLAEMVLAEAGWLPPLSR